MADMPNASSRLSPLILWPLVAVSLIILYLLLEALYNITLHPLTKYPGPKLWAASKIPYNLMLLRGEPHKEIYALHRRYGDTVRLLPNGLAFQSPDAWKEVMGHRRGAQLENDKDPLFVDDKRADLISSTRVDHARYRRALSHGFSAKSMQEQQPIIRGYIDLLVERLHGVASQGPVNVVSWYNYTTFDIIGDLAFGESFGCLEKSDYHPWVRIIFEEVRMGMYVNVTRSFGALEKVIKYMIPASLAEKSRAHKQFVRERMEKRIALGTPRPDFSESMLKNRGEGALTKEELYENANLLLIAGSETTATALSGATYLLTTHPEAMARITEEVRGAFDSEDEIDIVGTQKLVFLQAVLDETLRMYPPVPSVIPRITPPVGQDIFGEYIPGNTTLDIWHWPMYHSDKVFSKPFEFHPERWMGDPEFKDDKFHALQPFHTGPRNCLGMNLAYAEMRIVLSKVIWNFDLQLASESTEWFERNKIYRLWDKPPLMVHLTPRKKA